MCRACRIMGQWSDIDLTFLDLLFEFYLCLVLPNAPNLRILLERRLKRALL